MLGVKEVPINQLIPNKRYFFFSHTIKEQEYNKDLLKAILDKNISLHDHEVITDKSLKRLVSFGRHAGIVGAYNGIRTYGMKHNSFQLPKAETLKDVKDLIINLNKNKLPAIKLLITGTGRVGNGSKEILDGMNIKQVDVNEYLNNTFEYPVYTQIRSKDYAKRIDGKIEFDGQDFHDYPEKYESNFMRFSEQTDIYIAGHFHNEKAPHIISAEDIKKPEFRISVIADISCDIGYPIASTIRPSTIAEPIYGYDKTNGEECDYSDKNAIAVMAVDNLPCELPRDASDWFGDRFREFVIPSLINGDKDGILKRSQMTENGKLTPLFSYLKSYIS